MNKAFCGASVSDILRGLPGFENMPRTFFPNRIMNAFGALPGVTTVVHNDTDADNNQALLAAQTTAAP